jgi:hypothetical protein
MNKDGSLTKLNSKKNDDRNECHEKIKDSKNIMMFNGHS